VERRASDLVAATLNRSVAAVDVDLEPGGLGLPARRWLLNATPPYQLPRRQRDALSHLIVTDHERFNSIGSSRDHVARRKVSDELRSFAGINNDVTRILCHWLIVRPLCQFFASRIPQDKVHLPAVGKLQIHGLFRSIN